MLSSRSGAITVRVPCWNRQGRRGPPPLLPPSLPLLILPTSVGAPRVSRDADSLLTTLEQVVYPLSEPTEAELQQAVHAFVDSRRHSGEPPERILVELKELSRSVLRSRRRATTGAIDDDGSRVLVEQMVRWAIARYYAR